MRLCLLLVLSVAAAPISARAAQSPIFETFKHVCLDTRGAPDAVAHASADWLPADIPAIFNPLGAPFDQATVRSAADGAYFLLWGAHDEAGLKRRTCNLAGTGDRAARMLAKAWIGGLKPLPGSSRNLVSYLAIETPNGRRAPSREEASDVHNAGRLIGLTIATEGNVTTFSVSRFAALAPPTLDDERR